jgi:hypothetical protein
MSQTVPRVLYTIILQAFPVPMLSRREIPNRGLKPDWLFADLFSVADLERENVMVPGALILAAREIKRLDFGRKDSPVLRKLKGRLVGL